MSRPNKNKPVPLASRKHPADIIRPFRQDSPGISPGVDNFPPVFTPSPVPNHTEGKPIRPRTPSPDFSIREVKESGMEKRHRNGKSGYSTVNGRRIQRELAKMTYTELQDIINNATEPEFLKLCQDEYYRRIIVYNALKSRRESGRGSPSSGADDIPGRSRPSPPRTPPIPLIVPADPPMPTAPKPPVSEHRHFRLPLYAPSSKGKDKYECVGFRYSHFDGSWLVRQMDIRAFPKKPPVLLQAGTSGLPLFSLSLEDMRIDSIRDAEISPTDFESEWKRNGGQPYVPVKIKNPQE